MSATHITDFIPAHVLEREGYIHKSDKEALMANIDRATLARHGWYNVNMTADAAADVTISVRKAAEIIGVAASTLTAYIKMGYLRTVEGGVLLRDALTFDYESAKRSYLKSKA